MGNQMKSIVVVLKNRIFISIAGLFFLSLLIWFIGPLIKFGENNVAPFGDAIVRLLAILFVVVLWGLNNLRIQLGDSKKDRELLTGLQEQPYERVPDHASAQSLEELSQINETFFHALATLKKIKFSAGGRRKALYELPWYIIIGPPGAGKTTALINSTLEFPLENQFGKGALQGVGGTRNCDWWFTNDAVLIDTAGRYTTQDSHKLADSAVWNGFLEMLRKKRRRRPINGVIIAISLQDIMTQTEVERSEHAKTIRARIDELMDKLGVRIPIYLIFTKSDLVAGFTEFFEDLNRDEREQVWGISLPDTPDASQSPDFELLNREYDKLLARLYERVMSRIHYERDIKRRGAIFGFPQQMEALGPAIQSFIQQVFLKNRYQYQPYVRGFYFCSGVQDGTSIDRLMTQVSNSFGIPHLSVQSVSAQGKSFFLGNLFRSVIFPEAELVGANRRHEILNRWSRRGVYIGGVALIVGVSLAWLASFTQHTLYVQEVDSYLQEFKSEQSNLSPTFINLPDVLPALNALSKASTVYDQKKHPWLSGLGLYDANVDLSANAAYQAQLHELYLPRIISYLEANLKKEERGDDLYKTLRIYMMFNKPRHMDKVFAQAWFANAWESDFKGKGVVRDELQQHLSVLLDTEMQSVELDKQLVESSRSSVLRVPVSQRIYSRIRSNPEYAANIDMLNRFGESVRQTFVINEKVKYSASTPYLFTKEGYSTVNISPESGLVKAIQDDQWVLSDDDSSGVVLTKGDLAEISEKVKEHYLLDYNSHWRNLYDNLDIAQFKDIGHANDVLTKMVDPVYSPILSILKQGAINTQLSNQLLDAIEKNIPGKKVKNIADVASEYLDSTIVDKQFQSVNELLKERKEHPAAIDETMQKIRQLQEFVNELSLSPEPSKQSFEFVKARYLSGQGGAITALLIHAKSSPQPVKKWLETLADQTWNTVLQSSRQYINAEWKAQVYVPYTRALAGRYPLNSSAKNELALADFNEFFKPGGTIDLFYDQYLKSFVDTRGEWKNKSVDGRTLGLSGNLLAKLDMANEIKNIFFRGGAEIPSLTFQLKPLQMDKNDARFTFELGPQNISYSHGPKLWHPMQWIGNDQYNRIQMTFEGLDGALYSKVYEGTWAWFRLLDDRRVVRTLQPNIYKIDFVVPNAAAENLGRYISYEIKADSVNNPFGKNLLGSFRCPETL